jgi:CheY-like chemotaxis protein/glycine cleavage system H lipoate-binding protein
MTDSANTDTDTPKRRILVIDDEEVVHASLRRILSRLGATVDSVLTAAEGLDRLGSERYDLVISDLMMPGMNGIELLDALQERGTRPPILMITGYPTIRTAVQALRLGAMDYIAKPYTRKELLAPVKRALRLEESSADSHPDQQQDAPKAADLVTGDVVVLPHHAWAQFQQDGTFLVGAQPDFLSAVGQVRGCEWPEEMDLIEQGYISIRLCSEEGDTHGIAMPLSGQILEVNRNALSDPAKLKANEWLIRVLPSQLDHELSLLAKKR